jgi:chromosome segregation ATPase
MWTEEVRARLALPVDEWWSLMVKRAFEAKSSEAYQIKQDVDAALGEIQRLRVSLGDYANTLAEEANQHRDAKAEVQRLRQDLADIVENDEGKRGEVARLEAEVERLEGLILEVDNAYQQRGFPLVILSVESRRIRAALAGEGKP